MPAPRNRDEFFDLVRRSGVLEVERLDSFARSLSDSGSALDQLQAIATRMIHAGLLTTFQAQQLLQGKWRRFLISGKYKLLELLGVGGMGAVYLCEHVFMRRLVALKVLPVNKLDDPSAVERFYREARAAGVLDHTNIVRAYDIDQDDKLHFLVMEYVDGSSLHEIVARHGPMDPIRAAHYIRQAALGLQHAHEAGLVHRDIKPGNLLLDRTGTIKILDLGLARFFNTAQDSVSENDDTTIVGTADYLAPEQAVNSAVDIRADIYGLGGTFYYLLTGQAPFEGGTISQKLHWHQTRTPQSIRERRPEVPEALVKVIERMLTKSPNERYQTPLEVAEALTSWTDQPIPPPPATEMPSRSPASLVPGAQGGPVLPSTPSRLMPNTALNGSLPNTSTNAPRSAPRSATASSTPRTAAVQATPPVPESSPMVGGTTGKAGPRPLASRTLILAATGVAVVVILLGSAVWWVVSGIEEKGPASQPRRNEIISPQSARVMLISPEQAEHYLWQRCTVEMTVRSVGKAISAERYFLNSQENYKDRDNFQVTFTTLVVEQLHDRGILDVPAHFEGRTIRVTGTVSEYQKRPQIEIHDLGQIEFLNPETDGNPIEP